MNDDADVLTGLCVKRDDVRGGSRALVTTSVLESCDVVADVVRHVTQNAHD